MCVTTATRKLLKFKTLFRQHVSALTLWTVGFTDESRIGFQRGTTCCFASAQYTVWQNAEAIGEKLDVSGPIWLPWTGGSAFFRWRGRLPFFWWTVKVRITILRFVINDYFMSWKIKIHRGLRRKAFQWDTTKQYQFSTEMTFSKLRTIRQLFFMKKKEKKTNGEMN